MLACGVDGESRDGGAWHAWHAWLGFDRLGGFHEALDGVAG